MKVSYALGGIAGIIAGAIAGSVVILTNLVYWSTEFWFWKRPPYINTIFDIIYQLMVHVGYNAFWGAFFGLIIILIYNKIPGKGIKKGLYIGLIYCSLSIFYPVSTYFILGNFSASAGMYWLGMLYLMNGPIDKFVYGILFVLIYERLLGHE